MKTFATILMMFAAMFITADTCHLKRRRCISHCPSGTYWKVAPPRRNFVWFSRPVSCYCSGCASGKYIYAGYGSLYVRSYDKCNSASCSISHHLHVYYCPRFQVANGRMDSCSRLHGVTCGYTCDRCYRKVTKNPTCEKTKWIGKAPKCELGYCSGYPVNQVGNASLQCDGNSCGSTCNVVCDAGYIIPMKYRYYRKQVCQPTSNGFEWSAPPKVECYVNEPPTVTYCPTDIHIKTGLVKTMVNVPRPVITARGENLTIDITCPILKPPKNGRLVGTCGNGYQMSCTYTCDEGYHNITATEVTCLESRTWNWKPECEIVKCMPAPRIPKGSANCTARTYGTSCDYYCHDGYAIPDSLSESTRLTCSSEGVWEPRILPECWADEPPVIHNCSSDIDIFIETPQTQVLLPFPNFTRAENGDFLERKCNFDQPNVTFGIDSHSVVCSATDEEINKQAICNFTVSVFFGQSSCSPKLSPANGFLKDCKETTGSQCYYDCNAGYRRTGPNPVTCTHGQWSADIGCTVLKCNGSLPHIANGHANCTGDTYGSVCTYSCIRGYKIPKTQRLKARYTCGITGTWVGDSNPPECWVDQPPKMTNCSGGINITSTSLRLEVVIPKPTFTSVRGGAIETVCPYYREDTATLGVGEHRITCTGTDVELGTQTICAYTISIDAASCGNLDPPANGSISCIDISTFRQCSMHCRTGFDIPRSVTTTGNFFCSSGIWSSTVVPDCIEKKRPSRLQLPAKLYYGTNGSCSETSTMQEIKANFIQHVLSTLRGICTDPRNDCSIKNVDVSCGRTLRRRRGAQTFDRVKRMAVTDDPSAVNKLTIGFTLSVSIPKDENYTDEVYNAADDKLSDVLLKVQEDVKNETAFPLSTKFNLTLQQSVIETGSVELQCDDGYFTNPSTTTCGTCPAGFFVDRVRSSSEKTCTECGIGEYQDEVGQSQCKTCPYGTRSHFLGSKNVTDCKEIDDCESLPCQNNGICIDGKSSYHCECTPGFTGTNCSLFDCNFHECRNNGTCIANGADYNCTCLEEFAGGRCQYQRVHGGWSPWSSFSECTASCGTGERRRTRTCTNPSPMYGGRKCNGVEYDKEWCNQQGCTVDGQWGAWSNWTECSRACGGGTQNRTRMCDNPPPAYGGLSCEGSKLEKRQCNDHPCPVNGGLSPWSAWTQCSRSCEGGEHRRNRSCDNPPPSNGGLYCNDSLTEEGRCNLEECPPPPPCDFEPCQNNGTCVNNGSEYICTCPLGLTGRNCTLNDCSENNCRNDATCLGLENGYKCLCKASFTGQFCELNLVHGKWSAWGEWGSCTRRDEGKRSRNRTCDDPFPLNGGRDCIGDNQEIGDCPECVPKLLRAPPNGLISCKKDNGMASCSAVCKRGYGFTTIVPDGGKYECGPDNGWKWTTQNNQKRFEVPECIKGDDSQEAVATVDVKDLPCNQDTIKQVLEQAQKYLGVLNGPVKTATIQCLESLSPKRKRSVDPLGLQIVTKMTYNSSEIDQTEMTQILDEADTMLSNGSVQFDVNGVVYTASPNMSSFINCSEGSVLASGSDLCVKCQRGTYYVVDNTADVPECIPCPRGDYQPEVGQLRCLECDVGYSTEDSGTKNETDCVACPTGTYYVRHGDRSQGADCVLCGIGFYQPQEGSDRCLKCPARTTTNELGSTSVNNCSLYEPTTQKSTTRQTSTSLITQHASTEPVSSRTPSLTTGSTPHAPQRTTPKAEQDTVGIIVGVSLGGTFLIVALTIVTVKVIICRRAAAYAVAQKLNYQAMDMKDLSSSSTSLGGDHSSLCRSGVSSEDDRLCD